MVAVTKLQGNAESQLQNSHGWARAGVRVFSTGCPSLQAARSMLQDASTSTERTGRKDLEKPLI